MRLFRARSLAGLFAAAVLLWPSARARGQSDEVVRVRAELVQTDVTVVDRRGRPVEGLTREQFELKVDGRPVELSFFEGVSAGSPEEEAKLSAARGTPRRGATGEKGRMPATPESTRGRLIFFFVDDLHLAPDSLSRTRTSLLRFVDEQLADGDRAAVVSASGQVGFLQQLTDNKAVLREAVGRLVYRPTHEVYSGKVNMNESDANRVQNGRDRGLFQHLVEATQNEYQMDWLSAAMIVRDRVRQTNITGRVKELRTLAGLLSLMRSSAPLAGRKLVFFISDGFVVDHRKSSGPEVLRRVTDEAARVGAVVYSLDARGIFTDESIAAARNDYMEFGTRTAGRTFINERASKEPLETLADETGGRAFVNDNSFNAAFAEAAAESSDYYLLAWRPDTDVQRTGRSRVEVSVKGRPDLRVRTRKHLSGDAPPAAERPGQKPARAGAAGPTPDGELRAALASLYPRRELPLALSAGYLNTAEKGSVLAASMQLDSELLDFGGGGEGGAGGEAKVDVWGIAVDDRGSFANFRQVLTVSRATLSSAGQRHVLWNQQLPLPPGLYQLRVAARERSTGRTGSQSQWVEIPEAAPGRLALSSVFVGEVRAGAGTRAQRVSVSVSRRFARGSRLRFQTFVYGAAGAHVTVRARVLRGGVEVLTAPAAAAAAPGADVSRAAYSGELDLSGLAPGRYVLEVTAEGTAASAASQRADFVLE
jgi:VWFA-related protein